MDPTAWEAIDIFSTLDRNKWIWKVPRSTVEALLRELDPEGTEERRARQAFADILPTQHRTKNQIDDSFR